VTGRFTWHALPIQASGVWRGRGNTEKLQEYFRKTNISFLLNLIIPLIHSNKYAYIKMGPTWLSCPPITSSICYHRFVSLVVSSQIGGLFVWLVADGWCWFVLRKKYCWLVAGDWFVLREKYCWLVADKPNE
jgi:hypothetical protein